jgi:hypothetical protein
MKSMYALVLANASHWMGRLQKILYRLSVYIVQPSRDIWNVVISEVRHEQQIFPKSAIKRFDANNRDVRNV